MFYHTCHTGGVALRYEFSYGDAVCRNVQMISDTQDMDRDALVYGSSDELKDFLSLRILYDKQGMYRVFLECGIYYALPVHPP